ncbi:MAG: hypothetical protein COV52_04350 [Gammaproteobacteria bacterium CG11_big_fil_rev_8_21_14_0_20_46_22]|nr:MAG: hypothetical protein COV52_04350 [Gammaproteobacteria bacterium CG11_big_fil_rev_8_21_14_0_20_46_22]
MRKRQQRQSKKEIHPMHDELSAWGCLTRQELMQSLGFSSSGHALKNLGDLGVKISSQATGQPPWPSKLEKLDELIGELIKTKPAWGKAIKAYYTSDVVKNKVRMIAAQEKISKSTFHDRLQRGRDWIDYEMKIFH